MKISYQRTGGFAGMVMSFEIATDTLPLVEAEELQNLVNSADFFGLPKIIPSNSSGADQFQYQLTVETDEQLHSVEAGDSAMPENLWPLINKLRVLSRSSPK